MIELAIVIFSLFFQLTGAENSVSGIRVTHIDNVRVDMFEPFQL